MENEVQTNTMMMMMMITQKKDMVINQAEKGITIK
jgi:hypothetical protein